MTLLQLEVEQFRCIEHAKLEFAADANLIIGPNASGKTSFLEAIFLLGTGHSFRTHQTELLIRRDYESFTAVAKVRGTHAPEILGVRYGSDGKQVRMNGEAVQSIAQLALRLPVQAIDPEVHRLLEDGPTRRRRFLDWGVFHVEHQFHAAWRRYHRALKQRNAALKAKQPITALEIWNRELVEYGTQVADYRDSYLNELQPFINTFGQQLIGASVDVEHQRGWKRQISLDTALTESLPRDLQRGSTSAGPHRADLIVKVTDLPAKDRVSRGQQKMLACSLLLAQQAHRAAIGALPACLLLDDPAAELDVDNLGKLLAAVANIPTQLVITSLNSDVLNFFPSARVFHVKHGSIRAMA